LEPPKNKKDGEKNGCQKEADLKTGVDGLQ
jgi:hypothetical protein